MAYQKPKADHPWKTGRMPGYKEREKEIESNGHRKSVKIWITEIAESYDNIEMYSVLRGEKGKFFLWQLPQSRQAAWIAGMLKRNYETF